jgi:hypothetical protein
MAVMFQVEVFWVVTPCSVVAGHLKLRYLTTTLHDLDLKQSKRPFFAKIFLKICIFLLIRVLII